MGPPPEEQPSPPTREAVDAAVGSSWLADVDGHHLELVIVGVEAAGSGYVMDLRQISGPALAQGTVELSHPDLGTHHLFVVPQRPLAEGERWYAVTVG